MFKVIAKFHRCVKVSAKTHTGRFAAMIMADATLDFVDT
jgi:hypothetical protein